MKTFSKITSILFLLLLLLAGCTAPPQKPPVSAITSPPSQWEQHQRQIQSLNHWQAEGRLAIAHKQKGTNASFIWQQEGDLYRIKLYGPFGSGAVYIIGSPSHVELRQANGKVTKAASPEKLLQKAVGWQVPISGLRYWLKGLPIEDESAILKWNNQGYLQQLVENGWHINYESYATEAFAPLPNKLHLQNEGITVKMVIKSWKRL